MKISFHFLTRWGGECAYLFVTDLWQLSVRNCHTTASRFKGRLKAFASSKLKSFKTPGVISFLLLSRGRFLSGEDQFWELT